MTQIKDEWDMVHILVNNVGQATRGWLEALCQSDWQQVFEVNLLSEVHCTNQVSLVFQKHYHGCKFACRWRSE